MLNTANERLVRVDSAGNSGHLGISPNV
jgi:hypothetical protein